MTRVPAREQRYPPLCPDADYCWANDQCFWDCEADPDGIEPPNPPLVIDLADRETPP